MKQYDYNGLAGCVEQRRNQKTHFVVGVYNCVQAGMEDDPATPWATVCEEHHTICCHSSLATARHHAGAPEGWCEACRLGYLYNRMQDGYVFIEPGDVIGLVVSRERATMIGTDAPIRHAAMIAGFPKWQYDFVRANHDDMERLEKERHGLEREHVE